MRVGLLIPSFLTGKGGAEKVAAEVSGIIDQNGGTASILCNSRKDAAPSYELPSGVDIRPLNLREDDDLLRERGRYDVVVGFGMAGFFRRIAEISDLVAAPFVIQECTNPSRMVSTLYVMQQDGCSTLEDAFWLRQGIFSRAAAVRFTVPDYAQTITPAIKPFSYSFFNSLKHEPASTQTSPQKKIIAVGAMKNRNKNGMSAVEAFARFADADPEWQLHLYGSNNFYEELTRFKAENPKISITDHGIVSDPDKIYADASLLVIPSFEEGLPNVVIEAFSYGVPCVGYSDCPGVNYLISEGETGCLADRSTAGSLAIALMRASKPDFRAQMSLKAAAFAEKHLRHPDFVENWLYLLGNAVAGRNNGGVAQAPLRCSCVAPFGPLIRSQLGWD
ncbi:glycosyltransferase [Pararhizobium mangrovi]|uniref:Glycosyltransferase family 4 protein n=1 Tax=Pararhizobium mangrovi TaxID=2590452 RepID=A0A506UDZ5_9HYPH|nr:glycosyltransferase [Pararhizobium mangrovi]TPW32653.1 glycosyltransferase family 4 protein [Pararhizobium mangrovi]